MSSFQRIFKLDNGGSAAHRRFDRDVAWSAFAMLVPIAVGLAALPIMFRNLGETVFALFLLSYGAMSFAPSLDLGIARTAQRRIAYANNVHAEDQLTLARHALKRAFHVSIAAALIVTVVACLLLPMVGSGSPFGLALITGLGVGVGIYANTQRGILEGLGAFSRSALNRAAVGVMLISAPLIASFFAPDATILAFASLLVRVPFAWEQSRAIRAVMQQRNDEAPAAREDVVEGFMRESGWFALLSILAVAMSGFDRYLLIGWAGLTEQPLAIFLATQDMALRAVAVPAALLPALLVRLAAGTERGATQALSRRLFLALIPSVILGCVIVAWLSEPIATILYPTLANDETATALRILLFGVACNAIAQFPMTRLAAAGRARDAAGMHAIEFVLYIAIAPFLVSRFGAIGAASLWSGRVFLDTVLLISWSGLHRGEKEASTEGWVLLSATGILMFIWGFS